MAGQSFDPSCDSRGGIPVSQTPKIDCPRDLEHHRHLRSDTGCAPDLFSLNQEKAENLQKQDS